MRGPKWDSFGVQLNRKVTIYGMKHRSTTALWFFLVLIWITLGLLYLIRLHDHFKGSTLLGLGILSLFIALRFRKRDTAHQG